MFDALRQDLKHAIRSLSRSPSFTAAALLTLALGIGANTAIFSVLNAVVLRPLPYEDPARVVGVWNFWDDTPRGRLSAAEYFDYLDRVDSFESFGVFRNDLATLTESGEPARLSVGVMSSGVLPALGVAPALGRAFTAEEDVPRNNDVVLLSDGLWRRRYGASPNVVGQRILLDNRARTVVGVMPPDFRLPGDFESQEPAELFVPLGLARGTIPGRGLHFLLGVARLAPGVSVEQGAADIAAVAARFSLDIPEQYPKAMRFGATVTPLHEDVVGEIEPILVTLLGAIGFVLLIACANITNLFLSRGEQRRQEFAVRSALGAGKAALIRQTIVESTVVALAGGALGILTAIAGTRALVALRPPDLPRMDSVAIDATVLAFAGAISVVVGVLVGLVPALRAASWGLTGALRENSRALLGASAHRLRHALVTGEVALAIVLLLGAGLLARSFLRLVSVDPGYKTDHVLTASIALPQVVYADAARTSTFFSTLLDRVRSHDRVVAAGAVAGLPLASERGDLNFQIEGRETPPGTKSRRADWQVVTPGYFEAMGMRIVRGRGIERFDLEGAPGVIVFNESAARLHWPNSDPIGTRLKLGGNAGPGWVTVVGIVNDIRHGSLRAEPKPEMYLAHTQFRMFGRGTDPLRGLTVVVRSSTDPALLSDMLRQDALAIDPNVPVSSIQTMDEVRRASVSTPRFVLQLLSVFAMVALAVALIGVYGVMSYSVSQRRREIGLRVALGANTRSVTGLVLRQGLSPAVIGIAVGLAGGITLSKLLATQLYEVSPNDPVTATAVASLVAVVALLACYLPARRAAQADPTVALRAD